LSRASPKLRTLTEERAF